jgi:CubicO group peptidase (beta-lactamase class C family)
MTSSTDPSVATQFEKVGPFVTEAMERLGVPGAAVGIFYDGQAYTAGFGVTNLNHPLAVTDETLFLIASISKTFTATTTMRLVDQGLVDLDTPIKTYLPELQLKDPEATEKATLRHVFTHHGGWTGDYFGDFGRGDDALAKNVADMVNLEQLTPLGETFSYNNAGYALAARIVEVTTSKPFETAVKELVLDPLGMEHTFYFPEDAMTYRVAAGHQVHFDGRPTEVVRPWGWPRTSAALGGLITNVKDLLRYARFQMGDGSWTTKNGEKIQLLKPETIKYMQSRQSDGGSMTEAVGVAWMLRQAGEVRLIGHGGAAHCQMSILQIAPDQQFAVCVTTNASIGTNLCGEIVKFALENFLAVPDEEAEHLQLDSEVLSSYTGQYEAVLGKLTVELREGQLYLQSRPARPFPSATFMPPTPPEVRLAFTGPDQVVSLDYPSKGGKGDFLRDKDGAIVWFRLGGRIHRKINP